jgi:hypothetical protein
MILSFQPSLRPALPAVHGAKDYREFRDTLIEMDRILSETRLEDRLILDRINSLELSELSSKRREHYWRSTRLALRYSILRALTQESFRDLSSHVADSQIFQWFTHTSFVDGIRPVSKSSAERFEKYFTAAQIGELVHALNLAVADKQQAQALLYAETELRFDRIFADTTCVKADIHFPIDWVLLRDGARTLIKAIILIREHGLKHRIGSAQKLMREVNKLCIEMTHARKKPDAKKVRKAVFRKLKKQVRLIERHGQRYLDLLENQWEQTDWTEQEKNVVATRMRNILNQLPQAMKQAHERIIGERRVANKEKILSLYESEIDVLVRGKAGAEVEFGNAFYLAEQDDGLIVDWELMKSKMADSKLTKPSVERIVEKYGPIDRFCADRGFDSPEATEILDAEEITNSICPRSVNHFEEKLQNPNFRDDQQRRGATEARIAIFKNDYLGRPMRSRGFANREVHLTWCVLTHNLWKLASMARENKEKRKEQHLQAA